MKKEIIIIRPGIFVTGRGVATSSGDDSDVNDDGDGVGVGVGVGENEDCAKYSLCWSDPQLIIRLVDRCPMLTVLDLDGYEQLNDLVLEYIVGGRCSGDGSGNDDGSGGGLKRLRELTLPRRSFVTADGFRTLLEHLPELERIRHPGKMGQVFAWGRPMAAFGDGVSLPLRQFCQVRRRAWTNQTLSWLNFQGTIEPTLINGTYYSLSLRA